MTDETRRRIAALTPEQRKALAAKLAAKKAAGRGAVTRPAGAAIPRRDGARPDAPLSFAQHRMWFLHQLDPASSVYNNPLAFELSGPLDRSALAAALGELLRRHEVLRARLIEIDGEPRQVVEPRALPLRVVDLSELPESERGRVRDRLLAGETARPFDLERGPVVRALLVATAPWEHALLLTLHHVVSDGWSVGTLVTEVGKLYSAYGAGGPSPLPELEIQYADFADWQRARVDEARTEAEVAYWREELAGAPSVLELPTDRPRPAERSVRGAALPIELPEELTRPLVELGQGEGATLFMTLMTAFQTLMHRWSGQQDVVVGTPVAGRDRPELEPLIGFFVRTAMIRGRMHDDPTFRELLGRVRTAALGMYDHQDVPFERLVDRLGAPRDPAVTPLFQVSFVMQNYSPAEVGVTAELTLRPLAREHVTSEFDVTLTLSEAGGRIVGEWEYRTDLFDPETIGRLSRHFTALLQGVVADPDRALSDYPLVDPEELRAETRRWNGDGVDEAPARHLPEVVADRARQQPDAIAIASPEGLLTYGALDARANRLARRLRRAGVGSDARVGIHLERGPELLASVLAVLKAGGAYIPLDPGYPAERVTYILEDSGAELVISTDRLAGRLGLPADRVLRVDCEGEIERESDVRPVVRASAESLAYVIYTSGSTGRPKGAMVHHGGLANYLRWAAEEYRVSDGFGAVVHSPVGFDLTVTSLFCPLVAGATVHFLAADDSVDGLGRALAERPGMSLLKLTPSHLELLRHQLEPDEAGGLAAVLVVGGEALRTSAASHWLEHAPRTRIVNEYGPTETVVGCCTFELDASHDLEALGGDVPIGRPIAGARLYVMDGRGRPVPRGLIGELYIGGVCVTRGYLDRPALTAERFVPDPEGRGERLYRSGDVVRLRTDGELAFLGRRDDQVKIRGHRIELGEVEAVLTTHAAVKQAAVVDRLDHTEARHLVAYVVAGPGAEPDPGGIRAHMLQSLPEYMVPGVFVSVDALPLTPNGKLDRARLPEPTVTTAAAEPGREGPGTPLEELLAGIWADVLAVDAVGPADDFFQLGGHSLLATQLLSRVRSACGVELPVSALFDDPTVAGLAVRVADAMERGAVTPAPPIERAEDDGDDGLSFAQQRLWLLDRMTPDNPSYNVVSALRLTGPLNVGAFDQAVREIVRRHEILRTTFREREGRAARVVRADGGMVTACRDLGTVPERARGAVVERLVAQEANRPFKLAEGPLLRVTLLRIGAEEQVVVLSTHHIVCDGWSMSVLVDEFSRLYVDFAGGRPSGMPELPIQYSDFGRWQRAWMDGEVLEAQLGYWRQRLSGSPPRIALPTDRPRPESETSSGASHVSTLPADLSSALRALSRREGATLFMTMLAALKTQLHKYSGQDDILVGTDSAGRNRLETEGLIGFFINLLVLRTDLGGNPSFRDVLAQLRRNALEAYAHQDLPFERLVEELAPERALNETPLFQVLFVFQNTPVRSMNLSELTLEPVELPTTSSKFDLAIFVNEGEEEIGVTWQYKTDLFEPESIQRLARHYTALLQSIAANPAEPIHDLRMIAPSVARRPRRTRASRSDPTTETT